MSSLISVHNFLCYESTVCFLYSKKDEQYIHSRHFFSRYLLASTYIEKAITDSGEVYNDVDHVSTPILGLPTKHINIILFTYQSIKSNQLKSN